MGGRKEGRKRMGLLPNFINWFLPQLPRNIYRRVVFLLGGGGDTIYTGEGAVPNPQGAIRFQANETKGNAN